MQRPPAPPRTPRRVRRIAALLGLLSALLTCGSGWAPGLDVAAADGPSTAPPGPPHRPAAAALLPAEAPPAELATLAWLEHLGWRFVADPGAQKVVIQPGQVGQRASIAEAHAQGDLLARVPPTPEGAAELRRLLPQFVDGSATRLAWQHRVEAAAQVAAGKLDALNKWGRFKFPQLLLWNSPWFQFHPPPEAWKVVARNYVPSGRPSAAIESIHSRGGLSECYSAQWLLVYAIQYELFGREAFDEMLPAEQMVVGRPSDVKPTPIGQLMLPDREYPYRALFLRHADLKRDPGVQLATLGPRAFAGITGIVRAHDESDSCNQNFVHVSITPRACADLASKGGMAYVSELGRQLHKAIQTDGRAGAAEKARLLADPVLAEWTIYVHPFGIVSLGWMLDFEMSDEGKSAYLMLYLHAREDLFYRRYRSAFERRWLQGKTIGPDRRTQPEKLEDPRRVR